MISRVRCDVTSCHVRCSGSSCCMYSVISVRPRTEHVIKLRQTQSVAAVESYFNEVVKVHTVWCLVMFFTFQPRFAATLIACFAFPLSGRAWYGCGGRLLCFHAGLHPPDDDRHKRVRDEAGRRRQYMEAFEVRCCYVFVAGRCYFREHRGTVASQSCCGVWCNTQRFCFSQQNGDGDENAAKHFGLRCESR